MGGGFYSTVDRAVRSKSMSYDTKSAHEIFSHSMNDAMDPFRKKGEKVLIRESCDSSEHPESLAIVLGLDVTGSMGSIPLHLVRDGLPHIMGNIIEHGLKDPQLLFLAIGDHECDHHPLQVGQFESSDALLDKWLTSCYLEGGGGGNEGESYLLAWYFAGLHTKIDCFDKRKKKGFLFTIGDEPCLKQIPKRTIEALMGAGEFKDYSSMELLDKAKEMYEVYHLHIMEGSNGHDQRVIDGWKQLMGKNLILVDNHKDVSKIISEVITKHAPSKVEASKPSKTSVKESKKEEEIL